MTLILILTPSPFFISAGDKVLPKWRDSNVSATAYHNIIFNLDKSEVEQTTMNKKQKELLQKLEHLENRIKHQFDEWYKQDSSL
jgi:predicted transcriptional regulator